MDDVVQIIKYRDYVKQKKMDAGYLEVFNQQFEAIDIKINKLHKKVKKT